MLQLKKMSIDEGCKAYPEKELEIKRELKDWGYDKEKELYCLHCESVIKSKDLMVEFVLYEKPKNKVESYYLVCPNGECDGSPMDWSTKEENKYYKEIYELFA